MTWLVGFGCLLVPFGRAQDFGPADGTRTTPSQNVAPERFAANPFPTAAVPPAAEATPSIPAPMPAAPVPVATPVPASPDQQEAAQLEDLKAKIESAMDLDSAVRDQARALVQKAIEDWKQAKRLEEAQISFATEQAKVGAQKDQLTIDVERQRLAPVIKPSRFSSVEDLEESLTEKRRSLTKLQADLSALTTRMGQRAERRNQLREILSVNSQKVAELNQRLQSLTAAGEPALLVDARRASMLAEMRRLERELPAAQSELTLYDTEETAGTLQLQETLLKHQIAVLRDQVADWTAQLSQRRREDAAGRLQDATTRRQSAPDVLVDVFGEMIDFARTEVEVRQKRQQLLEKLALVQQERIKLDSAFEQARQREARAGKSSAFGVRLRQERRLLGDVNRMIREKRSRLDDLEQAQLAYLNWRDHADNLESANKFLERISPRLDELQRQGALEDEVREGLLGDVRSVLKQREEYAAATLRAYDDYIDTLVSLDLEQAGLIDSHRSFAAYIDERVLWIRSRPPLSLDTLFNDVDGLRFLASSGLWRTLFDFYQQDWQSSPTWYVLGGGIWLGLFLAGGRFRALLTRLGQKASNRLNTSMAPTLRASLVTITLSLLLPLPIWVLGVRAWHGSADNSLIQNFGANLLLLATGLFCLELTRQACRTGGLAEIHFNWSSRVCRLAASQSRSMIGLGTPLALLVILLWQREDRDDSDVLGRVFMIALSLLVAATFSRLTRPATGVLREWTTAYPGGWLDRLSSIWHLLAVAIPLSLGTLTAIGYDYTAIKLSAKLALTYLMICLLVYVRAMLFRGLSFRQRRMAIDQSRQRRAAFAAASEATMMPGISSRSDSQLVPPAAPVPAADTSADLTQISNQTKRLLQSTLVAVGVVGTWLIWVDVLPALNYFNRWTFPGTSITYAALGMSIIVLMLMTTAARNIPGVLEILLLQRLPLDRSAKYAIGAISRYCIIVVGLLAVGDTLGIGWGQVQWLVAALTFGLGFGLQEIFANFVSGIILLFEQPIRVGDVVTIDGVSGVVSRIRARATTITDWDRKEYVVPNREFITGKLLNWTLSDTVNRVVVNVGVSYDADPAEVTSMILNIIQAQPHVLKDPPPVVTLDGFGDNALNFVVRAFLPSLEYRQETTNELHVQILNALRKANIEIPFPQRDLHIRTLPPQLEWRAANRGSLLSSGDGVDPLKDSAYGKGSAQNGNGLGHHS